MSLFYLKMTVLASTNFEKGIIDKRYISHYTGIIEIEGWGTGGKRSTCTGCSMR